MSQFKPRVIFFWLMAALLLASSGWVHWNYDVNGIGVFGSYASVFGLILTFYVAESVRSVRSRYTTRVTSMQTFERLSAAIRDFDEATNSTVRSRHLIASDIPDMGCDIVDLCGAIDWSQ